jgi:hypothetical protein
MITLCTRVCWRLLQVYVSSSALDSDAIVSFVRCLVTISLDELRDPAAPRVFSLTKIVEISHFNMGRIRCVQQDNWALRFGENTMHTAGISRCWHPQA